MRNKKSTLAVRALPLLIATAYAGGAFGQENKLEEVIITAQKRAERLQDVPISISAISGSQLETRGIEGAKDLSSLAPNLMVTYGASGNSTMSGIAIRGSGSASPSIFLDTAVGTYVDGIYAGKNQGGLFDIMDLERVEVLRGPQGTLFGRNTLAGAINFVTKKPSGVFGGTVGLDVGNHGASVQRVSLDLPRMGALNLSLAARNETRDGYVRNANGKDAGKVDKQTYRLAATLDITSKLQAFYTFDHTDVDNVPLPVSLYTPYGWKGNSYTNPAIVNAASTSFPSTRNTTPGIAEWEKMKTDNHALTLSYQVNADNTVKYIYSDRKMNWGDQLDLDGVTADIYAYSRRTKLKTESHELQWVGSSGNLKYVGGYYAYKERSHTYNPQESGNSIFFATDFAGSVEAKALFAQLDYSFNDKWSGSLGIRRSIDEKGVDSSTYGTGTSFGGAMTPAGISGITLTNGPSNPGDILRKVAPNTFMDLTKAGFMATNLHAVAKKSFASTTPALSLTYKFNDGFNVYGRIAKGFRSGGFSAEAGGINALDMAANKTAPFNPEKSTTMELGFKSTFLDGRAQVSGAVYQNKITDLQTNILVPNTTSSIIVNAGKATYQGLELEGQFVVADGWRVGASWGYLDPKFDQYLDRSLNATPAGPIGTIIDTASNRTPSYAPKNTINLNVDGRLAKTAWGTLRGVMDISYTDKMYIMPGNKSLTAANAGGTNYAPYSLVPSRTLINARLVLAGVPIGGPGRADVALWVRNLADIKKPINFIDMSTYRVATWTEPRMVGLSFSYKW